MKSALKKLIIILACLATLLVLFCIDSIIAKTYNIEYVSITRNEEISLVDTDGNAIPLNVGVSDGNTTVTFVVKLTHNNKPVKNHVLYVKTNRNVIGRLRTDENGTISFDYRCYLSSNPSDVTFNIVDEDNSIFIYVPASNDYILKMIAPLGEANSEMTTNDIFYDID